MIECDLIIKNISQIVTPETGCDILKIILNGLIGVNEGKVVYVGPYSSDLLLKNDGKELDAEGGTVLPGFVDPHTHLVFSGFRENEFHLRFQGASYLEILKSGGGILQTVKKVRESSFEDLFASSKRNLLALLKSGSTTFEVKSGYGLDLESEIKMLYVVKALNHEKIARLIPTFLGLHALPPEFKNNPGDYVDYMTYQVLPEIAKRGLATFVDAFVEKGVFTSEEVLPFLNEAKKLGFKIRLHADEFNDISGALLAAETGAMSADHLLRSSDESLKSMADKGVVAILLPGTVYSLGLDMYPQYKRFKELGLKVALGTDFNPGTSMVESMEFIISLAVTLLGMPLQEAIIAATLNAAYSLGIDRITGSIEEGKSADMIIMDFPDFKHLGYRVGVSHVKGAVFEGKLVYSLI